MAAPRARPAETPMGKIDHGDTEDTDWAREARHSSLLRVLRVSVVNPIRANPALAAYGEDAMYRPAGSLPSYSFESRCCQCRRTYQTMPRTRTATITKSKRCMTLRSSGSLSQRSPSLA